MSPGGKCLLPTEPPHQPLFLDFLTSKWWCFSKCSCNEPLMHNSGYFLWKNWRSDFVCVFVCLLYETLGFSLATCPFCLFWALKLHVLSHLLLCQQVGQSYSVWISDKTVQHWDSCAISVETWPHWCVSRVWWLPSQEMLTLPADEVTATDTGTLLNSDPRKTDVRLGWM